MRGENELLQVRDARRARDVAELLRLTESGRRIGDLSIRAAAIRALGKVNAKEAIPTIIGALDDPDADVRWAATGALGRLGGSTAAKRLLERLEITDADNEAYWILDALGASRAHVGNHVGVQTFARHPNRRIRTAAARAAGASWMERLRVYVRAPQ